ncbi:MAG TPA: HIT family protein [Thermoanaerobaculia bacterium]|nr:HIT family protein [Thermoanaerobaculia bacterium]
MRSSQLRSPARRSAPARCAAPSAPPGLEPSESLEAASAWSLVPERESLREIHDLPPADRTALIEEIAQASEVLTRLFHPDKLNVGALGNVVPQLHVHVVARSATDPAWPGPVWGSGAAVVYGEGELEAVRERIAGAFAGER